MQLKTARVQNFKSILDSEEFRVDELTALVGKNEAGKTAVLQALYKLKPVEADASNYVETEYPRMFWSDYQDEEDYAPVLTTTWELTPTEVETIENHLAPGVMQSKRVTIRKGYENRVYIETDADYKKVAQHWISRAELEGPERSRLWQVDNVDALIEQLRTTESPSERETAFLADLEAAFPGGSSQVLIHNLIWSMVPSFVYYDNYYRLPGQVALDSLIKRHSTDELEFNDKVFLALLRLANTDLDGISSIETSEQLIAELEAVENRLSREIFKYWSQNKHLRVRFRFEQASAGDKPPFNTGKIFRTRIENQRHSASVGFDERSNGFIWFFSFLVWFSQAKKNLGNNLVILLDEPGLTLHGKAQADLLRYFNERLVPHHQVIYSTHSPFMIDSQNLASCRTVEDFASKGNDEDEVAGTKVNDQALSDDLDTVYPLKAALAYELTKDLALGEQTLLVEAPSDLLYINWASNELRKRGRTTLDPRWNVVPCGGVSKVVAFISLFGGRNSQVAVLTDFGHDDTDAVDELRKAEILRSGHIFTADAYTDDHIEADVEDLLGRDFYCTVVNRCYDLGMDKLSPRGNESSPERVVKEVREHFEAQNTPREFSEYAVAAFLAENGGSFSTAVRGYDTALENFERLFTDLNNLL